MSKIKKYTLRPVNQEIETVIENTVTLLKSFNLTDSNVRTQTMIIRQLLKYAIKYGNFALPENEITIIIHIKENIITVEVMSPVDTKHNHSLRELDKTIQFIRGYQDPFEAYSIKYKQAAKNGHNDVDYGLDLARIAYKGNVSLDFIIGDDNTLIQSAIRKLDGNSDMATYT